MSDLVGDPEDRCSRVAAQNFNNSERIVTMCNAIPSQEGFFPNSLSILTMASFRVELESMRLLLGT